MRVLGQLGVGGGVVLILVGIAAFAFAVFLWRSAPARVREYEENPSRAPKGWLGDQLPSVASLRFPAIGGFIGGLAALGLGVAQIVGSL